MAGLRTWLSHVRTAVTSRLSLYGKTDHELSLQLTAARYELSRFCFHHGWAQQEELVRAVSEHELSTFVDRARLTTPKREISLLREYRTRLIADVVTGKLDVRGAAARLQDKVEEPEPRYEDEAWSEPVDDDIARSEALH